MNMESMARTSVPANETRFNEDLTIKLKLFQFI